MRLLDVLMTLGGLALLLGGGELLLRGAVNLAQRLGLSPLLIGLTVVAAATSMPELVVVLTSGLEGVPDLGVGNVVGSNIANVLLILGCAAVLWPIATRPHHVLRDGVSVLGATVIFMAFGFAGVVGRVQGVIMLTGLAVYLAYSYVSDRRLEAHAAAELASADPAGEAEREATSQPPPRISTALGLVVLGVLALVLGSHWLIDGAIAIARAIGISEAVIGLTMVAVGTSLPELATAIVAGLRRHPEIALGNVLGSNLFNLLGVLAAMALVTPFRVSSELLGLHVWVMVGASLILLPVMFTGWRIGRREGAAFLVAYAVYIAVLYEPATTG
jgi:cation:H+ antiporter